MYPIDQDTYDKVNAYHIEFKTGALTSLRIPKIVEYYSCVKPRWFSSASYSAMHVAGKIMILPVGINERNKEAFKF